MTLQKIIAQKLIILKWYLQYMDKISFKSESVEAISIFLAFLAGNALRKLLHY